MKEKMQKGFNKTKEFTKEHKKEIIFLSAVAVGGFLAYKISTVDPYDPVADAMLKTLDSIEEEQK